MRHCGFQAACLLGVAALACSLAIPDVAHAQASSQLQTRSGTTSDIGDQLQWILPVSGLLGTIVADDREGRWQWAKAGATTGLTISAAKLYFQKLRPNAGSRTSYPSGHTAAAFMGASFIGTRYGPWWGVPAYAGAIFTGYSRVWADAHFVSDVFGGASVALLSNWFHTTPYKGAAAFTPMQVDEGFGINVHVLGRGASDEEKLKRYADFKPTFSYEYLPVVAFLDKNEVTSPANGGTTFDFDNFAKDDDPLVSTVVNFDWFVNERQKATFTISPFESRDFGTFSTPTVFGGQVLPANEAIRSAYRLLEVRAMYDFSIVPESGPWSANLRGGFTYQDTDIELQTLTGTPVKARVEDELLMPLVGVSGNYRFSRKISGTVRADGFTLGDNSMLEAGLQVDYHFTPQWRMGLGYSYFHRDTDSPTLKNKVTYHVPFFSVAHAW